MTLSSSQSELLQMKISNIIKRLEKIQKEYGDIDLSSTGFNALDQSFEYHEIAKDFVLRGSKKNLSSVNK
jgi:aminoglycoside N3'-acetyltransferase